MISHGAKPALGVARTAELLPLATHLHSLISSHCLPVVASAHHSLPSRQGIHRVVLFFMICDRLVYRNVATFNLHSNATVHL